MKNIMKIHNINLLLFMALMMLVNISYAQNPIKARPDQMIMVDSIQQIPNLDVNLGDRIKVKSTGAEYLVQADSVDNYTTDEIAVITIGSSYAVLQPSKENKINIKNFGLIGGGSNETDLIRKAFDYCQKTSTELYVPYGQYLYDSNIPIQVNTDDFRVSGTGQFIWLESNCASIVSGKFIRVTGNRFQMDGLKFKSNCYLTGSTGINMINLETGLNHKITNCLFEELNNADGNAGLSAIAIGNGSAQVINRQDVPDIVAGNDTIIVTDMTGFHTRNYLQVIGTQPDTIEIIERLNDTMVIANFRHNHSAGEDEIVAYDIGEQGVLINNCIFKNIIRGQALIMNRPGNIISNCRFENISHITQEHFIYDQTSDNHYINNIFIGGGNGAGLSLNPAVLSQDGSGLVISGNTFLDCRNAISIRTGTDHNGSNFRFAAFGISGIPLGRNGIISSNTFKNCGGAYCVNVATTGAGCVITNNLFEDCNPLDIISISGGNATVSNNTVTVSGAFPDRRANDYFLRGTADSLTIIGNSTISGPGLFILGDFCTISGNKTGALDIRGEKNNVDNNIFVAVEARDLKIQGRRNLIKDNRFVNLGSSPTYQEQVPNSNIVISNVFENFQFRDAAKDSFVDSLTWINNQVNFFSIAPDAEIRLNSGKMVGSLAEGSNLEWGEIGYFDGDTLREVSAGSSFFDAISYIGYELIPPTTGRPGPCAVSLSENKTLPVKMANNHTAGQFAIPSLTTDGRMDAVNSITGNYLYGVVKTSGSAGSIAQVEFKGFSGNVLTNIDTLQTQAQQFESNYTFTPFAYTGLDTIPVDTLLSQRFVVTGALDGKTITGVEYTLDNQVTTDSTLVRLLKYTPSTNTYTSFGNASITVGNSFVNNTPSQSIAQGDIIYCETTQTGDNVTGLTVTLKIE